MKKLFDVLNETGHEPVVLQDKIIILPFAGRIIGLFPDKENILWVNDSLSSSEKARVFFDSEDWKNIGGDRTWISPEIETHVDDPANYPVSIKVPEKVDPGAYSVREIDSNSVVIDSHMNVHFHQSGKIVPLNLTRYIEIMESTPFPISKNIFFAGYKTIQKLNLSESIIGEMRPGIWSLLQVPGGGEIIVPVKEKTIPTAFIGKPDYISGNNVLKSVVKTAESFKFGIKASQSKGTLIYKNDSGTNSSLIVRIFTDGDNSFYADYPSYNPKDTGYCAEIYIDDGALGGFGELEYHSRAIDISKGENEVEDFSQTWGFSGPLDEINDLCEQILNNP